MFYPSGTLDNFGSSSSVAVWLGVTQEKTELVAAADELA